MVATVAVVLSGLGTPPLIANLNPPFGGTPELIAKLIENDGGCAVGGSRLAVTVLTMAYPHTHLALATRL